MHLDLAMGALNEVDGICWHLSMKEFFEAFIERAKRHQMLFVQRHMTALVYASNSKHSCYTGFAQYIPAGKIPNIPNFLAA